MGVTFVLLFTVLAWFNKVWSR